MVMGMDRGVGFRWPRLAQAGAALVVALSAGSAAAFLDPAPLRNALVAERDARADGPARRALDEAIEVLDQTETDAKPCLKGLARVAGLAAQAAPESVDLADAIESAVGRVTNEVRSERDVLAGTRGTTGEARTEMRLNRLLASVEARLAAAEIAPDPAGEAKEAAKAAGLLDRGWTALRGKKSLRFRGARRLDVALGRIGRIDADDLLPRMHGASVFVATQPLPEGATFDTGENRLRYAPAPGDAGRSVLILLTASKHGERSYHLLRAHVTSLPEDGPTYLTGRVLRSESGPTGEDIPLDGIPIRIDGTDVEPVITDEDGAFTIGPVPPEGRRLQADGQTRDGAPANFACVFEDIPLLLGHLIYPGQVNEIDRPIYLPDNGAADGEVVAGQAARIEDPELRVCLDIAADSARDKDGSAFTGQMFIPRVDLERTPAALPDTLRPSFVIAIQPGELTFNPPARITFPNADGLAPGSETDIWSINPQTGEFEIVGTGRVTEDGEFIETISGGVRQSSWHFALPPGVDDCSVPNPGDESGGGDDGHEGEDGDDDGGDDDDGPGPGCGIVSVGSSVKLATGSLRVSHPVVGRVTGGRRRGLNLVYDSNAAAATTTIALDFELGERSSVPDWIRCDLSIDGQIVEGQQYVKVPKGQVGRFSMRIAPGSIASGIHQVKLLVRAGYGEAEVSTEVTGAFVMRNEQNSGVGSGWSIAGVDRLVLDGTDRPAGSPAAGILVARGSGGTMRFTHRPSAVRIGTWAASDHHGYPATSFVYNVNSSSRVPAYDYVRADMLSAVDGNELAGLTELTNETLSSIDVVALQQHVGFFDPSGDPAGAFVSLSESESEALERYVRAGGAAILLLDHGSTEERFGRGFQSFARFLGIGGGMSIRGTTGVHITSTTFIDSAVPAVVARGPFGEVDLLDISYGPSIIATLGSNATGFALDPSGVGYNGAWVPAERLSRGSGPVAVFSTQAFFHHGYGQPGAAGISDPGQAEPDDNPTLLKNLIYYMAQWRDRRAGRSAAFRGPASDRTSIVPTDDGWRRRFPSGAFTDFDARGLQTSRTDRQGRKTTYEYDSADRLKTITDLLGNATRFTYGSDGRLDAITVEADGPDLVTRFRHDAHGNLSEIEDPDGSVRRFRYDELRLMKWQTAKTGGTTSYGYHSGTHKLLRTNSPLETEKLLSLGGSRSHSSSGGSKVTASPAFTPTEARTHEYTNPEGRVVRYVTDELNRPIEIVDASGRRTTFERNSAGQTTRLTMPSGRAREFAYDSLGNMLSALEVATGAVTRWEYEPDTNWLSRVTDPLGNVTAIDRDGFGNPISVTDPAGKVMTYVWGTDESRPHELGQLLSVTTPLGHVTRYGYGADGNVNLVTDAEGRITRITTDAYGNVAEVKDGADNVTSFRYDALNLLRRVIAPDQGVTDLEYHVPYGAVGSVSGGKGPQLSKLTDALNRSTTFEFDKDSRLRRKRDPLGGTWTYEYWRDDRLKSVTDAKGQQTTYLYTPTGLLSEGDPAGDDNSIRFGYDDDGRMIEAEDDDSRVTFDYDLAGRLERTTTGATAGSPTTAITYGYDLANRRTTMTAVVGVAAAQQTHQTTYTYDSRSLVESITAPGTAPVVFAYDDAGRRATLTLPGGITCTYGYEDTGAPASISYAGPGGNLLSIGYRYDPLRGLIDRITDDTGAHDYQYDAVGRLTAETHADPGFPDTTFRYDTVGNRKEQTRNGVPIAYAYNEDHSMRSAGGTTFRYDANGSQTRVTTGPEMKLFTWDPLNRMVGFEQGATFATYRYDALGRRIAKSVNGVTTKYVYDGLDLIYEVNEANQIVARYTHGPGIDQPLLMHRGGQTYCYLLDHLGSVRAIADANGTVQKRLTYEAFGSVLRETGALANQFGYTSREPDAESGLMHYRARAYDSTGGRFASRDPIGFAAGQASLFAYGSSDPVSMRDPLGYEETPSWKDSIPGSVNVNGRDVPVKLKELRGRYGEYDPVPDAISINSSDPPYVQCAALCHEIGHADRCPDENDQDRCAQEYALSIVMERCGVRSYDWQRGQMLYDGLIRWLLARTGGDGGR